MLKKILLLTIIIYCPFLLSSQTFEVEGTDEIFEIIFPQPPIIPEWPTGVIFREKNYDYMSNLTDRSLKIADGPIGFQFVLIPPDYTNLDYNSLEFFKNNNMLAQLTSTNTSSPEGVLKLIRPGGLLPVTATYAVDGYSAISDRRLKHNIKPMTELLEKVIQLRPSTYTYNGFTDSSQGFIAQEVQKLFPELVKEIDGYLAVNYSGFSTIAIQAIKEQQKTISSLKAQVELFEKRLTALEKSK